MWRAGPEAAGQEFGDLMCSLCFGQLRANLREFARRRFLRLAVNLPRARVALDAFSCVAFQCSVVRQGGAAHAASCSTRGRQLRAHGLVVLHPLSMREALGSIPSVSTFAVGSVRLAFMQVWQWLVVARGPLAFQDAADEL